MVLAMLLKVEERHNRPLGNVEELLQLVVQLDVALVVPALQIVLLDVLCQQLCHLGAGQPGVGGHAEETAQFRRDTAGSSKAARLSLCFLRAGCRIPVRTEGIARLAGSC